jgi:hypothetical protein
MNALRMIIGLTFISGALVAILTANWFVLVGICIVAFVVFVPWFVDRHIWVRIPAMSTGLVYNVETKAFSRFLMPGRHLLRPLDQLKKVVPIPPSIASGECGRAQTDGGVNVSAKWSLAYRLDPTAVAPELRPNVANMLLKSIEPLLHTHINNCITHLFDQQTVATVCDRGARQRLERELRDLVAERLLPFGVQTYRVILKSVDLPRDVMVAVEAAHKQELLAESEARALERLHQVIRQFSDVDMERLLQLRQLQEMGQHGVTLHVPAYVMPGGQPAATGNGHTSSFRRQHSHFHKPHPNDQSADPLASVAN